MKSQRVVIVTGAGTGIGNATAKRLQQQGWRVFATLRRPNSIRDGPDALALDVTSDDSVAAAVAEVLKRTGRIDGIVNNAGCDILGAAEETTSQEAEALFQTNFFGVHRLIRAVLPTMRARGTGHIVTVGSMAGFLPTPFDAFYSASKHAVEGYMETLANEIAPFGIRCVLVEPGFVKTELRSKKTDVGMRIDVYAARRAQVGNTFTNSVNRGLSPDRVAEVIVRVLAENRPKFRQRVGSDAHMLAFVRRYMPDFVFQLGLSRQF